jgi:hypothetical protein
MTCYYYLKDPKSEDETGMTTVSEEDYVAALYSIAKKNGLRITNSMILKEIRGKYQGPNKMPES